MITTNGYVRKDEHGVYRVGDTRMMLDGVVYCFRRGETPEEIHAQYPSVSVEQIQGAIDYYRQHQQGIDDYLVEQAELFERLRQESEKDLPPVVRRLRKLMTSKSAPHP